ncbi:MAG: NAD(P)/FAD-dependent oxidoreductase, partial [Fimbriimonas sp.]
GMDYDVIIVGGGPAGSTCASLLKKYGPDLRVLVLEREVFPRAHVGESQLPPVTQVLAEMGVWEKVEAAGFPVKTGAMYRWGSSDDLWKFDFLVGEQYEEQARPGKLEGQRLRTTFHVERALYDKILLDHARELGAEVREGTKVVAVERDGDTILGLTLADGQVVRGTTYVDASGHVGFLRRQMGVEVDEPTQLKNIAIWDYWENTEWSKTVNKGGIRARIFSIGYGWIWFLPISETRTSIGAVTHVDHFRDSGQKAEDFYVSALQEEPFVRGLLPNARREGNLASTKDWSFTAARITGDNWYLVGESAGFADPILAAGMTLAHVGARELAHLILAKHAGEHDEAWLKAWYEEITLRRVRQHIRFADFWYSNNVHFTELKEFTSAIAADAGLTLDPDEGFRWLAAGGFASDNLALPVVGTYALAPAKILMQKLTGKEATWQVGKYNEFRLNLAGAMKTEVPYCFEGKIDRIKGYTRGAKLLPLVGMYRIVFAALQNESDASRVMGLIRNFLMEQKAASQSALISALEAIEGMIAEGWVTAKVNKKRPFLQLSVEQHSMEITEVEEPVAVGAYREDKGRVQK